MVGQQKLKSIFNHIEQYEKSKKNRNGSFNGAILGYPAVIA